MLTLLILSLPADVVADAPPPNQRGVKYTLTIENLGDYPDHVFLVYPTTNSGFAYVLEKGKGLTNLMTRKSWKGEGSALYVMTRRDFDEHEPKPSVYPHGDDDANVMVVRKPPDPPKALRANVPIELPPLVPLDSPVVAVERVVRIREVSPAFELTLVREVETLSEGGTRPRPTATTSSASAAPSTTPKAAPSAPAPDAPKAERAGCGGCVVERHSESSHASWMSLIALVFACRRRRHHVTRCSARWRHVGDSPVEVSALGTAEAFPKTTQTCLHP